MQIEELVVTITDEMKRQDTQTAASGATLEAILRAQLEMQRQEIELRRKEMESHARTIELLLTGKRATQQASPNNKP